MSKNSKSTGVCTYVPVERGVCISLSRSLEATGVCNCYSVYVLSARALCGEAVARAASGVELARGRAPVRERRRPRRRRRRRDGCVVCRVAERARREKEREGRGAASERT